MEVGRTVVRFKHGQKAGVVDRVWPCGVYNLHVHLKTATTLVAPQLHPDVLGRYSIVVPFQATCRPVHNICRCGVMDVATMQ